MFSLGSSLLFLRDPVQETARRSWPRAGRTAVRAPSPHRPTPFPQDPNPPAAGRAGRGDQAPLRGADPLTGSPVRSTHLSYRPVPAASNCVRPGARRLPSTASARTNARTLAPPPGKGLRRRGRARAAAPQPGRPGLGERAPAASRSSPQLPGVGRARVARGLQGQGGPRPQRRGLHAPSPSQRAAASADPGPPRGGRRPPARQPARACEPRPPY